MTVKTSLEFYSTGWAYSARGEKIFGKSPLIVKIS